MQSAVTEIYTDTSQKKQLNVYHHVSLLNKVSIGTNTDQLL